MYGQSWSFLYAFGDSLGLVVSNTSRVPIFTSRSRGSIVDITMVSEYALGRLWNWRKLERTHRPQELE